MNEVLVAALGLPTSYYFVWYVVYGNGIHQNVACTIHPYPVHATTSIQLRLRRRPYQ